MGLSDRQQNEAELMTVRTIGRVAQLLLDLRVEYERRPSETITAQIHQRIRDLVELEKQLGSPDVHTVS